MAVAAALSRPGPALELLDLRSATPCPRPMCRSPPSRSLQHCNSPFDNFVTLSSVCCRLAISRPTLASAAAGVWPRVLRRPRRRSPMAHARGGRQHPALSQSLLLIGQESVKRWAAARRRSFGPVGRVRRPEPARPRTAAISPVPVSPRFLYLLGSCIVQGPGVLYRAGPGGPASCRGGRPAWADPRKSAAGP